MVKYYQNGTIVPKEEEHLVRLVKNNYNRSNLFQAGIIVDGVKVPTYERIPDYEVMNTLLEFAAGK